MLFRSLFVAIVLLALNVGANQVAAGTILHQLQTTTTTSMGKEKAPREQYSIAYLEGDKFRHELYGDKTGKGEWRTLVFFDGKKTYTCSRDKEFKPQDCKTTGPGGPLEMLDNLVKSTGGSLQVKIKSFAFEPAGPAQTVAGEKCEMKKMTMKLEMGLLLGTNFVPAATGSMVGNHCLGKLDGWKPEAMVAQLKPFGGYFSDKADFDKFVKAIKEGVGLDLQTDTLMSIDMGGKDSKSAMRAEYKRTTSKVEKATVPASQFVLPKGFAVKEGDAALPTPAPAAKGKK